MTAAAPPATAPGDAAADARAAGLRYVSDASAGIHRKAHGKAFRYLDANGAAVRDAATLARIRALAIPPAWTEVWICARDNGHLQATGRDARGRKQYRYHARWSSLRDEAKFERMIAFGDALPAIRARVDSALSLPGLPREKVLATLVCLLQLTMMRIGNEEYARANHSYGLSTLRNRHVQVDGSAVRFKFRGKSGVEHRVTVDDRRLARIVKRTRELPGQELFQYVDGDGVQHSVGSADVNDYLHAITGEDYTAKDFRTWSGTVLAALALQQCAAASSDAEAKKNIVQAIAQVAKRLGNTPAICRKCYVHPAVLEAYLDGAVVAVLACADATPATAMPTGLHAHEAAVLALLRARLQHAR